MCIVPQGKLVGGTFKKTPLCSREGETGCVISWTSFREKNVPPDGRDLRNFRPARDDRRLRQSGPARRDATGCRSTATGTRARAIPVPGGPIAWSTEGPPPTPYLRTEGLVSAKCINDGAARLFVDPHQRRSRDKRTDRIGGEVAVMGMFLPGWGMHLADVAEAQGDLIREVGDRRIACGSTQIRPLSSRCGPRHALSRRLCRQRASLRADGLFRGHRRLRHRLLCQLSEVHGAGPIRHDPRGRSRPGGGATGRAAAPMRWSRSTSAIASPARLGDDLLVVSTVEQVRASSVDIHQRVMRGRELLTDARVTAAFLDGEGRPRRQPRDWVEKFRDITRMRMIARLSLLLPRYRWRCAARRAARSESGGGHRHAAADHARRQGHRRRQSRRGRLAGVAS